ncbi:acyl-CoA N-acyltransferase [Violaceomyces palustris]|uniref:Acyl-CoA N-acyltransferase n=1 Tax=Violaceomyces palustris TaxID=1673888 RepID=A0ACD0NY44_9BASI|nr:acyl-CoA N-acyltransferase [Violaceomyces palustris]
MTLTPDSELRLAFDPSILTKDLTKNLPSGLHARPLSSNDHSRGHLKVLSNLTKAPQVPDQEWEQRFESITSLSGVYYPIALIDVETDSIAALGSLIVEMKFLRGLGKVGHIEDIVVSSNHQGRGLGKVLIQILTSLSESLGCYKTILDCSPDNQAFYEKCGYKLAGVEMAKYTC